VSRRDYEFDWLDRSYRRNWDTRIENQPADEKASFTSWRIVAKNEAAPLE
jgi:hypothetical protein